ncbi:hypothetical protein MATL_G00091870 [Megalops atlanticus]|uniref:Uncharacterized protein n=1 Tax=Megalops atlanticus TaxID=7932 RepID=A0A9D3Q4N9_MEGAT|nr:hypothetical protein MATL_G00091870 [Megalops atlanticus]
MSRSAPKARAEKGRAPSVTVPPPPPTPAQNVDPVDAVPGRLSMSDWAAIVEQEEGEEVVAEILDELVHRVMEKCYQLYLQKQLIPFTVSRARDALVHVVEWQFLVRDEGDWPDSAPLWEQDSEPLPCGIDSWAQGCVPVIHSRLTPHKILLQRSLELPVAEVVDPGGPQHLNEHRSPSKEELSARDPGKENKDQTEGLKHSGFKAATLSPHPPLQREQRRKQRLPHRATFPAPRAADSLPLRRGSLSCSISKEERTGHP